MPFGPSLVPFAFSKIVVLIRKPGIGAPERTEIGAQIIGEFPLNSPNWVRFVLCFRSFERICE